MLAFDNEPQLCSRGRAAARRRDQGIGAGPTYAAVGCRQRLRSVSERPEFVQERIELITKWVDGGIRRGNNPSMLPPQPTFKTVTSLSTPSERIAMRGHFVLERAVTLDGVLPDRVPVNASIRVTAVLPGGR
jgi:hypothetical protein